MKKQFPIYKGNIQKNGLLRSSVQDSFELFDEDNNLIDDFLAVVLTEKGYISKKKFKIDFSKYKVIAEDDNCIIYDEYAYFDLKKKYGKEYKCFITQQNKDNYGWNQVFNKYCNLDSLEK